MDQYDQQQQQYHPTETTTTTVAADAKTSEATTNDDNEQQQLVPAYVLAMRQDENYVMSLRLMFLRAEYYVPKSAVTRLIGFLEFKKELHGSSKLCQDITLQDFTKEDMDFFEKGYHQVLPGRDSSGRSIIFFHRGNTVEEQRYFDEAPLKSVLRVVLHMIMRMVTNKHTGDNVQRAGYICVCYDCSNHLKQTTFRFGSQAYIWRCCQLINILPLQMRCIHYCYDHPAIEYLLVIARTALGPRSRARLRGHFVKTHVEIMYNLLQYGIRPDILPLGKRSCSTSGSNTIEDAEGFVTYDQYKLYIEQLRKYEEEMEREKQQQEQQQNQTTAVAGAVPSSSSAAACVQQPDATTSSSSSSYIIPTDNDVLLGRGGSKRAAHPGNVAMHRLLEKYRSKYESVDKFEKTVIAELILGTITKSKSATTSTSGGGGRFLRQDIKTGEWHVVSDKVARERIAHGFRNRRLNRNTSNESGGSNNSIKNQRYNNNVNRGITMYASSTTGASNMITNNSMIGTSSILSSNFYDEGNNNNNCFNFSNIPCIGGGGNGSISSGDSDGDDGGGGGGIFMNFNKRPKTYHFPM